VDSPKMAESWGSTVAAPIFREVALDAIHYLNLAPQVKPNVRLPLSNIPAKQGLSPKVTPEPRMNPSRLRVKQTASETILKTPNAEHPSAKQAVSIKPKLQLPE
jgi:hypothetical protein